LRLREFALAIRYYCIMRCSSLFVLSLMAATSVALGKDGRSSGDREPEVTVNMDALTLPEPAPIPEIPATPAARPGRVSSPAVPLPRPKPSRPEQVHIVAAPATQQAAPPASPKPPSEAATPPPKADLPVSIVENFPVELRGAASDPFADAKQRDPAAGFQLFGRVRFTGSDSRLPADALPELDAIAETLMPMTARIRLAAYSGKAGDLSSQARRLSLERARIVRDYLVSRGVSSERIDIMPFGGATQGVSNRVDVLAPEG
jgi:outer membrane protein OmpA-like peptidoglycan-associated protein